MGPEDVLAPQASLNFEASDLDGFLPDTAPIPREALLAMSRGNLRRYLTDECDEKTSYVLRVRRLWSALLATMRDSSVVDSQMTAVCNATCVFLQSASLSPVQSVQAFAMSAETWMAVFETLLDRFDGGKLKPLRQVLNTLMKILGQHEDRIRAQAIQDGVLSKMTSIILLGKPVSRFKASMVIFEAFIRSGMPLSRILSAIGTGHGSNFDRWDHRLRRQGIDSTELRAVVSRHVVDESVCHFSFSIILAVADSSAQATAGTFFNSFMSTLTGYGLALDSSWFELIVIILHRYPQAIEAFKNCLLPLLLKLYPNHCQDLLSRMVSNAVKPSMLENALTVAILGCNAGLLSEEEIAKSLHQIFEKGRDPSLGRARDNSEKMNPYAALLTHSSFNIRIRAYELLTTSTTPIRGSTLRLISNHLVYLYGDADPGSRGETSIVTKLLIQRLRLGSASQARILLKPDITNRQRKEHKNELKEHEVFLDGFIGFLERELGPNCSFPRHISALRALQLLAESGLDPLVPMKVAAKSSHDLPHWPLNKSLHYRSMKSTLWWLLLNPFEEVRTSTTLALKLLLENTTTSADGGLRTSVNNTSSALSVKGKQDESQPHEEIAQLVGHANRLAALTNRADHADGVGRLLGLQYLFTSTRSAIVCGVLESLERVLGISSGKVSLPATDFSIHGYLIGLKYIIGSLSFDKSSEIDLMFKNTDLTIHRLLDLCNGVWYAVRNDLCVDSPEVSREADATGPLEGPQDFLSYSWRALRDSSFLMQAILLHLGSRSNEPMAKDGRLGILRTIYALCFEQLTALRHRGAFSTVAQTFSLCCEQFTSVSNVRTEFKKWYQDAFQILEDQSARLTRRSAGLPAIMICILIPGTLEEFNGVIGTLASLARSERTLIASMTDDQQTRLPQVHALNCLREIFINSRFKERTVSWLVQVLDLAASSLSSRIWAIRNCGLMLFQACAGRIGAAADVSDVVSCDSVLPNRSEAMLSIAFKLLNSGQQIDADSPELVFAGLDLMSRIIVPANVRDQAKEQILSQLGSPIWMIREHAARLYASQLPETQAIRAATNLISLMAPSNQNKCHGILLCSRKLLGKYVNASLPSPSHELLTLEQALEHHTLKIQQYAAPAVQSAFLDIVNDYIALQHRSESRFQTWCAKRLHWTRQFQLSYQIDPQVVSGTPFESQLQSSKAVNSCLIVLTGVNTTAQTLHRTFQQLAAHDLDAAAALLQAIKDQGLSDQAALQLQLDFYTAIIRDSCDENITASAMFGLSSCLDDIDESQESLITKHDLERLTDGFVNSPFTGCRDLFNARIKGLGSVLAYKSRETQSLWNQHSSEPLSLWTTMLSNAAKDSTEALTRLNAAESLYCFRRCFLQDCDRAGAERKLILYSTLYDLLNDDDEEIRDVAASTASFILKSAAVEVESQLCPLAACHRFSGYIAETFSRMKEFHSIALSRVMLPPSIDLDAPHGFAALVSRCSVKKQLDLACQESHDLFEEERQNLYWDDIREIDIWCLALSTVSSVWLDADVRILVGHWTLEGLCELRTALPSLTSGPFGVLSKLEITTLFMRVIRLAELLLQWEYSSDGGLGPSPGSTFLTELERLLHAAQEYPIHPQVQKALEDGVGRGRLGFEQLQRIWNDYSTTVEY